MKKLERKIASDDSVNFRDLSDKITDINMRTRAADDVRSGVSLWRIDLCGKWQLREIGNDSLALPANVPGCVHGDLLAAGEIEDPFYRDNELDVQWISEAEWSYCRTFKVSEELLNCRRVLLVFEGLDTLAKIQINGELVSCTDNMFRKWEFDVKKYLRAGENEIEIIFLSPVKYVREHQTRRPLPGWSLPHEISGRGWIRKTPCNFGWDWGPILTTSGIWKPVYIEAFDVARIAGFDVEQTHDHGKVRLDVTANVERVSAGSLQVDICITHDDEIIAETKVRLEGETASASLVISDPKLWWPNNIGDQPLYDVRATLSDVGNNELDRTHRRIGLRTLVLQREKDEWGESFQFVVNGVPFFAKGANWIPSDAIFSRVTHDDYKQLLTDSAAVNMNMIRVWGGGYYEDDSFYDICDELGICVWQDFMFACCAYPTFDDVFMENVRVEAQQNVQRLRHHPCIALWCGNNELEQGLVGPEWTKTQMSWDDYTKLFDKMLPEIVHRLSPGASYWPGSPHSPNGNRDDFNNPACGDAHLWEVWTGRQPLEWFRTCEHRFSSEFGFQSFPEPRTVDSFTVKQDRNICSYIMEFHQRSLLSNAAMAKYVLDWYRFPGKFNDFARLSQILQGLVIKYAVEHWRRSMPRGMGTLYWQLNDCWPVVSCSSIDYFGRWKALQYMTRKFFAPQLISAVENDVSGEIEIHITNDRLEKLTGRSIWSLVNLDGEILDKGDFGVMMDANSTGCMKKLEFAEQLKFASPRNLIFHIWLETDGGVVSDNLSLFCRPKHMELQNPNINMKLEAISDREFTLTLAADKPALWVWIENKSYDLSFSDNFFHMIPPQTVKIDITSQKPTSVENLKQFLSISSLRDTY